MTHSNVKKETAYITIMLWEREREREKERIRDKVKT